MANKKILIVYYSLQGNTREVAKIIQNVTGGDLFEIELKKPYSTVSSFTLGLIHAKMDHKLELKNKVTNLQDYDIVFIGSPVWGYTLTSPIKSFLADHNLEGKTVVPFCTHKGNTGKYFEKFAETCAGAEIINGKDFYNVKAGDRAALREEIDTWVQQIQKSDKKLQPSVK